MWDWLKFSFKVYVAYLTAQLVIWLVFLAMVCVGSGIVLLITLLVEGM